MTAWKPRADSEPPELVIAAALRLEARALRRGAASARLVRTGMGATRARRAAVALRQQPAGALAVVGISGALDESLEPGELVVVSAVGRLEGGDVVAWQELASAQPLLELFDRHGHRPRACRLATMERVVSGRMRGELRRTGAEIVDMETAHLAGAAAGRPLAVVRVVVDTPHQGFASFALLRNGVRALRVLAGVAPVLEAWAAECARASRSRASSAPAETPQPDAASQQPTWRSR